MNGQVRFLITFLMFLSVWLSFFAGHSSHFDDTVGFSVMVSMLFVAGLGVLWGHR